MTFISIKHQSFCRLQLSIVSTKNAHTHLFGCTKKVVFNKHMTIETQSRTSNMNEFKKELAIKFAQNLRKHGVILDKNVFVHRLILFSQQNGIKHITKLKAEDVDKCFRLSHS